MPQIRPYTAETNPAVPDRPLRFFETGEAPGAELTKQAVDLSNQWVRIAGALQATQNDLEFSHMKAQYDAGIDLINSELAKRPDLREPGQYEQAFIEERAKLEQNITKTTQNQQVSRAFGTYVGLRNPKDHVQARVTGFKLVGGRVIAELNAAEDDLSRKAGEAPDVDSMKEPMYEYGKLVDRAYQRGIINDVEKEKRISSFDAKFRVHHMDYTERTDPEAFLQMQLNGDYKDVPLETQAKYVDKAATRIRERDAATNANMKKVVDVVENWWGSKALNKTLTDDEIQDAINGNNPFITPEKANHYKNLRDGGKLDNTPVQIIMSRYAGAGRSEASIAAAMSELNNLEQTSGRTSKELLDAKRMLSQDANAMRGEERAMSAAERAAQAAQASAVAQARAAENQRIHLMHEEQRKARELYDMKVKAAPFFPLLRGQYENELFTDRAAIDARVRSGVPGEQAVKEQYEIREKAMQELEKRKQTKGGAADILKKLEGTK